MFLVRAHVLVRDPIPVYRLFPVLSTVFSVLSSFSGDPGDFCSNAVIALKKFYDKMVHPRYDP